MALKLITEDVDYQELEILLEQDEKSGKKSYTISGPFIQAEVRNKNKRIYRKVLAEREVSKFTNTKIKQNRAWGELDHPPSPIVSLKTASHMITEINMVENNGMGKAKILDTPMGRIAHTILDSGGQLMVSTRGLGSLDNQGYVNNDFELITVDIVADGSAPDSYVDGILENREFIIQNDSIDRKSVV